MYRIAGTIRATYFAVLIVVGHSAGWLYAGNPLQTNDSETPGANGWEVNISHNMRFARPAFSQALPLINVNYGWLENDQWKISVPVLEVDPHPGDAHWGIGDIQLGWKYRFLEEDEHGFMASIYPQPLLPTGNASLGLGNDRLELFFPAQVGKYLLEDKLFVYAEAGHNFVFDDSDLNSWFFGIAAECQVTDNVELVFETVDIAFPHGKGSDGAFFNVGANFRLTEHVAIQTAFGRSFFDEDRGVPFFNSYVGLHVTWGGNGPDADEKRCCRR